MAPPFPLATHDYDTPPCLHKVSLWNCLSQSVLLHIHWWKPCSLALIQPASLGPESCKEGHSAASSPLLMPSPCLVTSSSASAAYLNHTNSSCPMSSTSTLAVCSNHINSAQELAFTSVPWVRHPGRHVGVQIQVACLFCHEWKIKCHHPANAEEMCQQAYFVRVWLHMCWWQCPHFELLFHKQCVKCNKLVCEYPKKCMHGYGRK